MNAHKACLVFLAVGLTSVIASAAPTTTARASLKYVMVKIIEPASNGVFYISRQPPKNDDEWKVLQGQALMLSEIATSLTTPARAKDKQQWMQDAKLLLDAANVAYAAANAKDTAALEDLNDQLYTACKNCHEHYFPKRKPLKRGKLASP
jgi:cytochrome c553